MDENTPAAPEPKTASTLASLTPEQMRVMLAAGTKRGPAAPVPSNAISEYWNRRRFLIALAILGCGVLYALVKTASSPAWVVIINSSGDDARAVTLVRGSRRVELGEMVNGASQKIEVTPGDPLELDYTIGTSINTTISTTNSTRAVWHAPKPLLAYETLNIVLAPGGGLQAKRDSPWSRKKSEETRGQ